MNFLFQILYSLAILFAAHLNRPEEASTYHVAYVHSKGFSSIEVTTNLVIDSKGLKAILNEVKRLSVGTIDTSMVVIVNVQKLPIK